MFKAAVVALSDEERDENYLYKRNLSLLGSQCSLIFIFIFWGHFALFAYVISLVFIFVEHRGLTIFLCSSLSPCYCSFNLVVTFHHSMLHWAIVATL
jgi:hypothetical protein